MPHAFPFSRHAAVNVLAALCLLGASGVQAETETSRDAVTKALETNPDVRAALHTFDAAGHEVGTARGDYFPSVDLSAGTGEMTRDYDDRGSYTTNRAEISVTQLLFDGFRTIGEVSRLDRARQVRYLEFLETVNGIALESFETAENLVRYRTLLDLARVNYQEHLDVQVQIQERVDQGVGRRADLDQVQARVALAESNLITEASNLHDVTAKYLRVVGELPAEVLVPDDLTDQALPESVKAALFAAYQGNPGFHAAIKNIAAAQAAVRTERANYYPRLELRARYGTEQNLGVFDDRYDPDDFGQEGAVELALTYNLFNGGSDRAAVKRSLAEVDTAIDQRDQACTNLRQNTQIAYNNTQQLAEQLVSLKAHRDASNRVRLAYNEQFQIGQRSLLDLLDAENEYFQSSRALVNGEHDLNIAYARVFESTGDLLNVLGIVGEKMPLASELNDDLARISVEPSAACPALAPGPAYTANLITDIISIEMGDLFAGNSSVLNADGKARLDAFLAGFAGEGRVADATVTPSLAAGSSMVNQNLASARAKAVRDYLVINGVESAKVKSASADEAAEVRTATDLIEITVHYLGD
ncbi:TolC family outer membrane protein [Gilvimarinus algae]|uniref:TolC family outer membrane protein n=1 Tax=Gilvimarinus algae TaxID=3058037 RepID=A0ABT8T8T3_9GAMM|nr:TolC family outer membrane protein [Gilvimarinus sp. SDUM040014]MDO3380557.1 TolC family outer membrane protein [Gilvimarinus sp. SDUM040014]